VSKVYNVPLDKPYPLTHARKVRKVLFLRSLRFLRTSFLACTACVASDGSPALRRRRRQQCVNHWYPKTCRRRRAEKRPNKTLSVVGVEDDTPRSAWSESRSILLHNRSLHSHRHHTGT